MTLLKVATICSALITIMFAFVYYFTGREAMILPPIFTALVSILGWWHLNRNQQPIPVARVVAGAIYFGIIAGIYFHPTYMVELSLSLPFVLLLLGAGGDFIGVMLMTIIIVISIITLAPSPEVLSATFQQRGTANQLTQKIDLYALISFVVAYGIGGVIYTYRIFQLHQQLHDSKHLDTLTRLPNRSLLEAKLSRYFDSYQNQGNIFHVIFLDINDFTRVNNVFGHKAGDRVLTQMGGRLEKICREYNEQPPIEAFRFGGDEFVILVPYQMSDDELKQLSTKVFEQTRKSYAVDANEVEISISIGLSTCGGSTSTAAELLNYADIAMYTAKNSGQRQVIYETMQLSDWDRNFLIQKHLLQALDTNEIYLDYQPIIDTKTQKMMGVEALARWQSDKLGYIPADEFIAVAEASGLIHRLGLSLMEQILQQVHHWKTFAPTFKVMINVSPYQLKKTQLLDYLKEAISQEPDLAKQLVLEITESAPFTSSNSATQMLKEFRALGFSIALDDYGTGSTSFLNLQQGAFSHLKLDKTLVQETEFGHLSCQIVRVTIESTHSLGLSVTAEGVETEEQFKLMREMGADLIQGYWFFRPVTSEVITNMLQENFKPAFQ